MTPGPVPSARTDGAELYDVLFGDDAPHSTIRMFTGADQGAS